ncbi:hypothetical protein DFA_04631 [Cavenderia fasciculata]|uniref:ABC transporter G family protein n=1 Tax=Cavenderia fasciculata TaxID=261658 RepID=F4PQ40_CACFS|nr:uncharacterized protein DFA_04631 [Cavenderia fasciculata]EGG22503.1 hypothetical protein DFA_04631 [Cavenderia fasciculata]|eukprot:XP_004360354.1 hypothetical protein DFA_04631 [Cavenderia fasciculata]
MIGELALRDCANRIIGGGGRRGISGGEARRVSIAIQMLSNPGVLFLDEPTSGLDSFSAHNLVSTLLTLSRHNKTVICTIHQPRSDIFNLFDYVLLLSKGKVVYFGQTKHIVNHFAYLGYECPYDVNPSDYFLDLITINYQTEESERDSKERLGQLISGFRSSPFYNSGQIDPNNTTATAVSIADDGTRTSIIEQQPQKDTKFKIEKRNTSFFLQVWLLYHRAVKNMVRDKSVVSARLVESVLIALICGGMFYDLGDDLEGIKSRVACFYIVVILQPYLIIISNILQFSEELLIYDREHYDGMYDTGPYWLAIKAATLPLEIVTAIIFSCIFYWMTGLRNDSIDHFFYFALILFLAQYTSACLGFMATSLFRSFAGASLMANLLMTFWAITTGFIINPATFVFYMRWIAYTSLYQYSYGALASNEFRDNHYPCPFPAGDIQCQLFDGDDILARLQLKTDNMIVNIIVLVGIASCFNLISLIALKFVVHKPK